MWCCWGISPCLCHLLSCDQLLAWELHYIKRSQEDWDEVIMLIISRIKEIKTSHRETKNCWDITLQFRGGNCPVLQRTLSNWAWRIGSGQALPWHLCQGLTPHLVMEIRGSLTFAFPPPPPPPWELCLAAFLSSSSFFFLSSSSFWLEIRKREVWNNRLQRV